MKYKLLLIAIFFFFQAISYSQSIQPLFVSVIVNDMDTSKDWYVHTFNMEVASEYVNQDRGFKIINLASSSFKLELIEMTGSLRPAELVSDQKTRIQGLFKIGFELEEFDQFLQNLDKIQSISKDDIVKDPLSGARMIVIKDPDGNRLQFFEKGKP